MEMNRPDWLFDRAIEWEELGRFVARPGSGLAVVYGRRRQGKTLLLDAVSEATGAFYWQARQQSSAQSLAAFGEAVGEWAGAAAPLQLRSWDDAFRRLFAAANSFGRPIPVLIDEFGYLVDCAPEIPSIIQAHLTPAEERSGHVRLVLCGSALGQMRGLLAADAPLRGRAQLELRVRPFDYRTAATFWGVAGNPDAAFVLHALVGGTPAYRVLAGEGPERGDISAWARRHLLAPTSPLFREGRIVAESDPALTDRALYWGVLGAIAEGSRRRVDLAETLGRRDTALAFPLGVLAAGDWIELRRDPLHRGRTTISLTEPIVRTSRLLIEPHERRLDRGQAREVWEDSAAVIATQILGPHLESIAIEWMWGPDARSRLSSEPTEIGSSTVSLAGQMAQVDLVAVDEAKPGRRRVLAVGEVKATAQPVGIDHLQRLDAIASRLAKPGDEPPRRVLVARRGFTVELTRTARARGDVDLVTLDRLYAP